MAIECKNLNKRATSYKTTLQWSSRMLTAMASLPVGCHISYLGNYLVPSRTHLTLCNKSFKSIPECNRHWHRDNALLHLSQICIRQHTAIQHSKGTWCKFQITTVTKRKAGRPIPAVYVCNTLHASSAASVIDVRPCTPWRRVAALRRQRHVT